jgi:hypothetical protein
MEMTDIWRSGDEPLLQEYKPFNAYESAKEAERDALDAEMAEYERKNAFTSQERWGAAFDLTGIIPNIKENLKEDLYFPAADPSYRGLSNEDLIKDLESSGIPFQYAPTLKDSVSEAHYEAQKRRIKGDLERLEVVSGATAGGLGYTLGAGFMDPVGIGVGVATGGWGALSKAGKITNAIRQGSIAGGINAGLAGVASYGNPTRNTAEDMAFGFAFGALLGGGVGAWAAKSKAQITAEATTLARLTREADNIENAIRNGLPGAAPTEASRVLSELDQQLADLDFQIARYEGPAASKLHERIQEASTRRDNLIERLKAAEASQTAAKMGPEVDAAWAAREVSQVQQKADDLLMMSRNERLVEEGYSPGDLEDEAAELLLGARSGSLEGPLQAALREAGLTRKVPVEDTVELQRGIAQAEQELKGLMEAAEKLRYQRHLAKAQRDYLRARKVEHERPYRVLARNPEDPGEFILTEPMGDTSAGAAQVREFDVERAMDSPEDIENTPYASGGPLRWFDSAGFLGTRKNPFFRFLGKLGEDGVGLKKGGEAGTISAEEHATHLMLTTLVAWRRVVDEAFEAFDQGGSLLGKDLRRQQFMHSAADAYESMVPTADPNLKKAVDATRNYFQVYERALKESGVRYAQNLEERPNYLPHIQDINSIDKLIDEFGNIQVNDMLYGGIQRWARKNGIYDEYAKQLYDERIAKLKEQTGPEGKTKPNPDSKNFKPEDILAKARKDAEEALDKLYRRIADGYLGSIRDYGKFRDEVTFHGLTFNDRGAFISLMKKLGMADDEVEKFANIFGITSEGKPSRFKSRVNFEMDFKMDMKSKLDGSMKPVAITQLFHRDLDAITELYGRQVSGHYGLAKVGIYGRGDFDELLRKATEWHRKEGPTQGVSDRDFERAKAHAEYLYKAVIGAPLEDNPAGLASTFFRRLRDVNVLRLMGQVGFAQVAEFGRILGTAGIGAMYKQMPAFRNLINLAGSGKLDNQFLRELEAMIATGTHSLRNKVFTKLDEFDDPGTVLTDVDRALHKGKYIIGNLSFMNYITTMQQRMASAAIAQKIADLALKGKHTELRAGALRELKSYGLSEEMIDRVFAQLNKHTKKGTKGEIHLLQIDKWDDMEAASSFKLSLFRAARRVVQENSYGGTIPIMHHMLGKVMMQFRNFMVNSWTKQTLNGLTLRNMEAFNSLMLTTFFGGLAYIAQKNLTLQHDPKALKEAMTPMSIGLAAINRSGYTGLVAPFVDTAVQTASMGTVEGPFAGKRSTQGLASGFINGNPTVDLLDKSMRALFGAGNAAVNPGYKLSRQDIRNWFSLLPYSNTLLAKPGFDLLMENSGLPKYSTSMSR